MSSDLEGGTIVRWLTRSVLSKVAVATVVVSTALVPALVSTATAAPDANQGKGQGVTVMTRNLYLGADIQRPINAAIEAQPDGAVAVLLALGRATYVTRAIVDKTDFTTRSELLAEEIADERPDLVGLQEVAWWRHGPMELGAIGVANATTTDYDFLEMLLDDLADEGVEYTAVQVQTESDVEAPSFRIAPTDGTGTDVRLTMRDVILMRVDDRLDEIASGGDNYSTTLPPFTIGDISYSFLRGYNWADVRVGSKEVRFINTHLEAFSSDVAFGQAAELLAGPAAHDGTTIIVCDCNSDPLNSSIKTDIGDTLPHKAAYELITGSGGFTDQWLEKKPAFKGWTSGLSETVDDETAAGFDHRIDMIFAREADGTGMVTDRGEVTGDELSDRDPVTGLWPSDHAGVVLRLR
ncbi:MAG: endonuclease/exonuclease/phosphatase family protein [Nocardioidaceae bacterium]